MNTNAFGNFLGPDTLIIFLVILIFFGGKRLPKIGHELWLAMRETDEGKREYPRPPWTWYDYLMVATVLLLAAIYVIALVRA